MSDPIEAQIRAVLAPLLAEPVPAGVNLAGVEVFSYLRYGIEQPRYRMYDVLFLANHLRWPLSRGWSELWDRTSAVLRTHLPTVSTSVGVIAPDDFTQYRILVEAAFAVLGEPGMPRVDISVPMGDAYGQAGAPPRIGLTYRQADGPWTVLLTQIMEMIRAHALQRGYRPDLAAKLHLGCVSCEELEEYAQGLQPNWNGPITYR